MPGLYPRRVVEAVRDGGLPLVLATIVDRSLAADLDLLTRNMNARLNLQRYARP